MQGFRTGGSLKVRMVEPVHERSTSIGICEYLRPGDHYRLRAWNAPPDEVEACTARP
jgi:hypothetical protein